MRLASDNVFNILLRPVSDLSIVKADAHLQVTAEPKLQDSLLLLIVFIDRNRLDLILQVAERFTFQPRG
jgi:hypothetical protein